MPTILSQDAIEQFKKNKVPFQLPLGGIEMVWGIQATRALWIFQMAKLLKMDLRDPKGEHLDPKFVRIEVQLPAPCLERKAAESPPILEKWLDQMRPHVCNCPQNFEPPPGSEVMCKQTLTRVHGHAWSLEHP